MLLCTEKASVTFGVRTLECPWWQLKSRGHFRKQCKSSLAFVHVLCLLKELPGFIL